MITKCFTFGYGQHDPVNNTSQAETYARITAPTEEMCRQVMFQIFGNKWAFEYGEDIERTWPPHSSLTQKYHIIWGEVEPGTPAPMPLPNRRPIGIDDLDDEEALGISTVLDPDDGPMFDDDAPLYRGVETVELPKEDVR